MGLYYDENGQPADIDDAEAAASGLRRVSPADTSRIGAQVAAQRLRDESGFIGAIKAGASSAASAVTLGGSDWLLDEVLDPSEKAQLLADQEAHPYVSAAGTITGAVLPALAAPGTLLARTPAGYLGSLAARGAEAGLARGGVTGLAQAGAAFGVEGAVQNVGQYLGHAALADTEITVEGVAASGGIGLAFGASGGLAALGVIKGTIAAKNMFSRTLGPRAAEDAASAWSKAHEEIQQAHISTMNNVKAQLDDIARAKVEATKYRMATRSAVKAEKNAAEAAGGVPPEGTIEGIKPAVGGMQTSIRARPEALDPADARAFDEGLPSVRDQVNDVASAVEPAGAGAETGVYKTTPRPPRAETPVELGSEYQARLPTRGADVVDDTITTVPAKDIEAHGWDSLSVPGTDKVKTAKGQQAIKEGQRDPITIAVSPNGRYTIEDGTHRLAAAIEQGKPIKVKWVRGSEALDEAAPTGYVVEPAAPPDGFVRSWAMRGGGPGGPRGASLREYRIAETEELLGKAIAQREDRLLNYVETVEPARKEMEALELDTDQIASLRSDNKTNPGSGRHKLKAKLESTHEVALENRAAAEAAGDAEGASVWDQRAQEVEDMMMSLPDDQNIIWNLEKNIVSVEKFEKALADGADALGDDAHPLLHELSKGRAESNVEASRKVSDRATRATEDAETFGTEKTPKERVADARARELESQVALDDIRGREMGLKLDYKAAKEKVTQGNRDKRAALKSDKAEAKAKAADGKLAVAGGVLELIDIPGMPKPSDLPVIGPLVGMWLKYRALKAGLQRVGVRIPFGGDVRVAAVAAKAQDRLARAVDGSLGVAVKVGRYSKPYAPHAARILATRIYDNGEPEPKKSAGVQELAAARMSELRAYATHPTAIEIDVRRQLRDVTDPDVIAAAEKQRRAMVMYLVSKMPPVPDLGLLNPVKWQPSAAQAMSFSRRLDAANDPVGAFERMAADDAVSLEAAETVRAIFPAMFALAQQRLQDSLERLKVPVPYRRRLQMSLFYQRPLEPALEPENFQITQSVYDRKPAAPPPGAPQGPVPSVAQPTDVAQAYMTSFDRR